MVNSNVIFSKSSIPPPLETPIPRTLTAGTSTTSTKTGYSSVPQLPAANSTKSKMYMGSTEENKNTLLLTETDVEELD